MKHHLLKTWPDVFKVSNEGLKTFEVRVNDRNYEVGDIIILAEFIPCPECSGTGRKYVGPDYEQCCDNEHGKFTGYCRTFEITYILQGKFGLPENLCVMQLRPR